MKDMSLTLTDTPPPLSTRGSRKSAAVMMITVFFMALPRELPEHLLKVIYYDLLFFLFGKVAVLPVSSFLSGGR